MHELQDNGKKNTQVTSKINDTRLSFEFLQQDGNLIIHLLHSPTY